MSGSLVTDAFTKGTKPCFPIFFLWPWLIFSGQWPPKYATRQFCVLQSCMPLVELIIEEKILSKASSESTFDQKLIESRILAGYQII
jgi:hypothetical protein